ncbi:MAG: GIY-YIG nuclease family protein [Pseudomonadota bacterium]|jgi:hypothetical protein
MDRTTMKKAYKDSGRPMGVFIIKNTQNDRLYIDCSIDLPARINRHKAELRFRSHRNRELQEAWDLLGEQTFKFEILDLMDNEENAGADIGRELKVLQEMWIGRLKDEGHAVVAL